MKTEEMDFSNCTRVDAGLACEVEVIQSDYFLRDFNQSEASLPPFRILVSGVGMRNMKKFSKILYKYLVFYY